MTLADTDPQRAAASGGPRQPTTQGLPAPAQTRSWAGAGRTMGILGLVLLGGVIAIALFAPLVAHHSPTEPSGLPFSSPSAAHPLGTDDVGHDLFAQLVFGARLSLVIGLGAAAVAVVVGTVVALLAGFYRGWVEIVLMRTVDLMLGFPFLVLVIVLAAFFGRGLGTTITVIATVLWARPARILRSQVLRLRELDHVLAARAMGSTGRWVLSRHILPRIAPLAGAQFVRAANVAVMLEASLAFLGLGDPNRTSWGTMLYFANARNAFLTDAWQWWILPPGLALTVVILGLAFLGYAIEEWADPRLRRPAPRPLRRGVTAIRGTAVEEAPAMRLSGLVVEYRGQGPALRAVDGVDLHVGRGQLVGLVGESGSGKTTIALTVAGVLRPPGRVVSGALSLAGYDLGRPARPAVAPHRGRTVALVPQAAMNALNPAYTIVAQVAEAARLTREPREALLRAHQLLERVGLAAGRHTAFPHELSGGMRQRAVIAMALANDPALLVADEPASGLDVITRAQVLKLLLELRDDLDVGILLVSHDLPTVSGIADEIAVMHEGRIVEHGSAHEVSSAPRHPYTQMLFGAFPSLHSRRGSQLTPLAGNGHRDHAAPAAAPVTPVLELDHVTKRFRGRSIRRGGGVVAVDDVSLSVAPGEIVAVVGESGAGKSTLARLILGLERPDDGAVRLEGQDLCELSSSELRTTRQAMHLVLQDPFQSLHPGMRVEQAVGEPLAVRGVGRRQRADAVREALVHVSMTPATFLRRFPHQLSGGQRQRVALARAIVAEPRLVVADEPTSMLDASLAAGILELILAIRDRFGTGFVYITHDLAVARWVSDRMVVMREGRIVEAGPSGEVVSRPQHPYTRLLLAASSGDLDHIPFNEEEACPVGN